MAKKIVCAVFDHAIGTFGQPFFVPATGAAVRSFSDEVNRAAEDNNLYNHPSDFDLCHLGSFDDEQGLFSEPEGGRKVLLRGKDARRVEE